MTETAVLLLAGLAIGAAFGYGTGRHFRGKDVSRAAEESLEVLRSQQRSANQDAVRHLPPTVTVADALEHAARHGIPVTEAADHLYRLRVKALLDRHIGRITRDPNR